MSITTHIRTSAAGFLDHLKSNYRHNISTIRAQPLVEFSGAFGDLGTFIPIFIALVSARQVSAPATLVFSGIANILTGVIFGIPLPVQPMKAIAAIAIQQDLSNAEIAGAGLFVATAIGLLSLLGLLDWFLRVIPVPVVKGIQVGAGLSLMLSAFSKNFPTHFQADFGFGFQVGLLMVALLFLLLCTLNPRIPFVLVIVILSIIASLFIRNRHEGSFSIWKPEVLIPSGPEFLNGALTAGLGQLPLTALNSVIAVVILAQDLFPAMHAQKSLPSAAQIGISVALMNMIPVWFRSMPFCHGSGGLAAQYRFGARSGASVMMLGTIKLVLGLFAADLVVAWCQLFSSSGAAVLGILMFLAGLELARMGQNLNSKGAQDLWEDTHDTRRSRNDTRDQSSTSGNDKVRDVGSEERMRRWTIMTVTIGVLLGAKNDGIGFIAGMVVHWAYMIVDWHNARQETRIMLE